VRIKRLSVYPVVGGRGGLQQAGLSVPARFSQGPQPNDVRRVLSLPRAKASSRPELYETAEGADVIVPSGISHGCQLLANALCFIVLSDHRTNISSLPEPQETAEGDESIVPPRFSHSPQVPLKAIWRSEPSGPRANASSPAARPRRRRGRRGDRLRRHIPRAPRAGERNMLHRAIAPLDKGVQPARLAAALGLRGRAASRQWRPTRRNISQQGRLSV
jgi:hypothetical protein